MPDNYARHPTTPLAAVPDGQYQRRSVLTFLPESDASRQVGSLLKPAVYLTALATGQYSLLSPLDDSAVQVASQSGDVWT